MAGEETTGTASRLHCLILLATPPPQTMHCRHLYKDKNNLISEAVNTRAFCRSLQLALCPQSELGG